MLGMIRMAGLGLCLMTGLIYANASASGPAPSAKTFGEPLSRSAEARQRAEIAETRSAGTARSDRLHPACGDQAWPYIAADCLGDGTAARPAIRTITVSEKAGPALSTLGRVPGLAVAAR